MNKLNKNGFTLIESMIAISMGSVALAATFMTLENKYHNQKVENLSKDISSIIEGFDKRVGNDGFELNLWSKFSGSNYQFNNRQQVQEFLAKAFIARSADGCGAIDGWQPIKDDPVDEAYKDQFKFIPCNLWAYEIPFELNAASKIIHDGTYVQEFELDLYFDNDDLFKDNFLSLKEVFLRSRSQNGSGDTGVYDFLFVNRTTDQEITTTECLNEKSNCGFRATYTGSDNAQEYLQTNGNNNMIGSKVKFQEDIGDPAINSCHRYQEVGGNWTRIDDVYCGIGLGLTDPTDLSSPKLDYVELAVSSVSTNKIFLDKICKFQNSAGVMKNVPCGIYNDGAENKVVASYDEVYSTDALVSVLEASIVNAESVKVKTDLTVDGTSKLKGNFTVDGTSDFNDIVKISGDPSDLNFIVETSASLKDVDIKGALNVEGIMEVTGDVNIDGSLDVMNQIKTKGLQVTNQISSNKLGTDCSSFGNGTIVYYNDGSFSDLAVCASNKWKLVNTQPNQVVAFNGSCPSGFAEFNQADGRVLVGAGTLYDADSGRNITYNVGDIGGEAMVALTVNEMPSHSHTYTDAYFSEHWGWEGPRNQPGGKGGQDNDNNLYTMSRTSAATGGNQAHENRMPYYVVNWCIYQG